MKQLYTILLMFLGTTTFVFGQAVDVITGLNLPTFMELNGTNLYVSENGTGSVLEIDLTAATPTATPLITGLFSPYGLLLNGTDLYIADNVADKIVKADISSASPTLVDVITGVHRPIDLVLDGNTLYYRTHNPDTLLSIDITAANPTPTTVGVTYSQGLALKGNDMYFTDHSEIKKIDLTTSTITTVLSGLITAFDLLFIGDELYIADYGANKIVKADMSAATPTLVDVATNVTAPRALLFDGNDLYISEYYGSKISKVNIFPVSTNQVNTNPDWNLFPNPATDALNIKGLKETLQYQIINSLGQVVQEGTARPSEMLSVNNLSVGVYAIRLENGELRQFMKQ